MLATGLVRQQRAITIREAATLARRSVSWVRTHREFGPLVPAMVNGRQAVTLASLNLLIALEAQSQRKPSIKPGPRIHLVIDNTK